MKQAQFEMARDILDTKRLVLEDLERSESEAQRLESALNRVRQLDLERSKESSETSDPNSATSHVIGSSGPVLITPIRKPASSGFLGALRHSLNGITDVDPESTRRNSIGKNKDYITNVREVFFGWLNSCLHSHLLYMVLFLSLPLLCWIHSSKRGSGLPLLICGTALKRSRQTWTDSRDKKWRTLKRCVWLLLGYTSRFLKK
jgi:hypothetical protein